MLFTHKLPKSKTCFWLITVTLQPIMINKIPGMFPKSPETFSWKPQGNEGALFSKSNAERIKWDALWISQSYGTPIAASSSLKPALSTFGENVHETGGKKCAQTTKSLRKFFFSRTCIHFPHGCFYLPPPNPWLLQPTPMTPRPSCVSYYLTTRWQYAM